MVTISSFKYAYRGLRLVLSRERNARIHLAFAILAIVLGILLKIGIDQFLVIIISITLVFFAEITNTALEKTLDLTYQENNQLVRFVKDMTAAGVLVAAACAIVVAILVFGPPLVKLVVR